MKIFKHGTHIPIFRFEIVKYMYYLIRYDVIKRTIPGIDKFDGGYFEILHDEEEKLD